jgi:glutathione S-transferase
MPFHQVPVLQLEDGRMLAQMAAIGEQHTAAALHLLPRS